MYKKEKTVCFTGHRTLLEPRQDVEKNLKMWQKVHSKRCKDIHHGRGDSF